MKTALILTKAALLIALTGIAFATLTASLGGLAQAENVQLCAAPITQTCFFAIL